MSRRPPILRALCLAALLGLGLQIVYAAVIFWVFLVGYQLFPSKSPVERLRYMSDGTPFIYTYSPTDYQSQAGRTLDGKPLTREELEHTAAALGLPGPRRPKGVPLGWTGRIKSFNDGREPAIYWYFVHTGEKDGYGHFVGYDSKLKLRVGYIGADGFRRDEPTPEDSFAVNGRRVASGADVASAYSPYYFYGVVEEPFYSPSLISRREPMQAWHAYLVSSDRVLEIDVQERSVRTVIESDGIVSIGISIRRFPMPEEEEAMPPPRRTTYLAIRFRDRVQVVDPRGEERRTYLVPEQLRARDFSFLEKSDGIAIFESRLRPNRSPVHLHWVRDLEEGTVRSETIALKERPEVVLLDYRNIYLIGPRGIEDPRIVSGLVSLATPVSSGWVVAGTVGVPVAYVDLGMAPDYAAAVAKSFSDVWPGMLISIVLSAGATWLCLKRQRQYAAPWTRTWAVFVFLMGIPGLLGYLFCRPWPLVEECPACRDKVPRDRESCSRCAADFPEPEPRGIEVLV